MVKEINKYIANLLIHMIGKFMCSVMQITQ